MATNLTRVFKKRRLGMLIFDFNLESRKKNEVIQTEGIRNRSEE